MLLNNLSLIWTVQNKDYKLIKKIQDRKRSVKKNRTCWGNIYAVLAALDETVVSEDNGECCLSTVYWINNCQTLSRELLLFSSTVSSEKVKIDLFKSEVCSAPP